MNDLCILIARLGCPSMSARWWTMQELAARLGEPELKAETEFSLLQLLRSRKLEAEVVEVLCIFWMAVQEFDYSPSIALAESILLPSPLSDLLVTNCGLPVLSSYTRLEVAPENFQIPDDFGGVQGMDLPRIFLASMSRLETYSQLPFIRQMAFEWANNRVAYPDAPYQGDSGHFIRLLGDGFISQLSTRAALRAISAYLRTLAVAEHFWRMPKELVSQESLLALPIHPTLAMLRPKLPDWFPATTDFDGDDQAIDTSIRALLSRVEKAHPGDELIAFNSPVVISMERCVEVSVVRLSQIIDSEMEDVDFTSHLKLFWAGGQMLASKAPSLLSTTTLIAPSSWEELVNEGYKAWPLARALDLDRIGYLQHDLYPSRLFLPTMPSVEEIEITPQNGQLLAKVKDEKIAELCYWNAGWGRARPRSFGGNCGTALISRGRIYREGSSIDNKSLHDFYFWRVNVLSRTNTYKEFSEEVTTGIVFVS